MQKVYEELDNHGRKFAARHTFETFDNTHQRRLDKRVNIFANKKCFFYLTCSHTKNALY